MKLGSPDWIVKSRTEAATRAYCDAWCSEYAELGQGIPDGMKARSGPAYEATKRCMIEALMAADKAERLARASRWTPKEAIEGAIGASVLFFCLGKAFGLL